MKVISLRLTKGWILLGMIFLIGCATPQDVRILDREIRKLESQLTQTQNRDQKEKEELRKELSTLRGEISPIKQEISSLRSEISSETQKLKADLLLRLESLQTETRILSTGVEEYKEYLKKPTREVDRLKGEVEARVRVLEEKGRSHDEQFRDIAVRMKGIEEQLKWIEARWRSHEDRLKLNEERVKTNDDRLKGMEGRLKGIEEGLKGIEAKLVTKPSESEKPSPLEEKVSDLKSLSVRVGDLYRDAYETFQRGDLEGARKKFEAFLSQYPHTELSDNAQFWIGETYFLKKDYERAILEYEKVIVKYPEGDKVPSALLKQGLAFLELGDKTNGRSLLKRVTERYPKTEQAEIARKRLESIK